MGELPQRVLFSRTRSVGGVGRGEGSVATCDLRLDQRQQLTAVGYGVFARFEATDQDVGDAGVVVVENGVGDCLRRADQGGGVAPSAGRRGDRHPEALVEDFLLRGEVEESLRSGRARSGRGSRQEAATALRDDAIEVVASGVPGFLLGAAQDGPEGDAELRIAAWRRYGAN